MGSISKNMLLGRFLQIGEKLSVFHLFDIFECLIHSFFYFLWEFNQDIASQFRHHDLRIDLGQLTPINMQKMCFLLDPDLFELPFTAIFDNVVAFFQHLFEFGIILQSHLYLEQFLRYFDLYHIHVPKLITVSLLHFFICFRMIMNELLHLIQGLHIMKEFLSIEFGG